MNRDKIREEAKALMDEFSQALDSISLQEDIGIERDEQVREPELEKLDKDFRKRMFENAPRKNDEYIIAEKKKW